MKKKKREEGIKEEMINKRKREKKRVKEGNSK